MKLDDFNYKLPDELVAQNAVTPRSHSRLLVVKGSELLHRHFYDSIDYLQKDDVLVLNKTRVLKNKLVGHKVTGAKAEMILMGPIDEHVAKARIQCSKVRVGNKFVFNGHHVKVVDQENDIFFVEFAEPLQSVIDHHLYPNPPYIKRTVGEEYQTVYADEPGSLAAPTSGLHFTPELLKQIREKGVDIVYVTLHVGFGTFLPVRDPNIVEHKMEPEYYIIDQDAADRINNANRLFVVGTTALKALESSAKQTGKVEARSEFSDLFIFPGFDFKLPIKGLFTNFHLPKSTLILLISAFYGWDNVKNAYETAVDEKYRFFSLGDATLFLK